VIFNYFCILYLKYFYLLYFNYYFYYYLIIIFGEKVEKERKSENWEVGGGLPPRLLDKESEM
jgi:hypothetical protein